LVLWVVRASNNKKQGLGDNNPDLVTAVYACDREDAERRLAGWFEKHPDKPHHYFTEQPHGYLMGISRWLPGRMVVS
jgi:hypothetical protein